MLLKEDMEYFEEEIIKENNDYSSSNNTLEKNKVSLIASKIENIMDKIFEKVKDKIGI